MPYWTLFSLTCHRGGLILSYNRHTFTVLPRSLSQSSTDSEELSCLPIQLVQVTFTPVLIQLARFTLAPVLIQLTQFEISMEYIYMHL
jgi:hypothetical protein